MLSGNYRKNIHNKSHPFKMLYRVNCGVLILMWVHRLEQINTILVFGGFFDPLFLFLFSRFEICAIKSNSKYEI